MLHARIVSALEATAPDRLAEQVERLAHHALRGEVWDKALAYFHQAGAKASAHSANREAVMCFELALMALPHLPESRVIREQAIDLRLDLRNALFPLGELSRVYDYLREAEAMAESLNDYRRLGWISATMAHYFYLTGDQDRAIEVGQRALATATTLADFPLQLRASLSLGEAYHALGMYQQGMAVLRQNVASRTGDTLAEKRDWRIVLSTVASRSWLAWCLAEIGMFAEGIAQGEEAVRIAEAIDHPFVLVNAHFGVGLLYLYQGDLPKAVTLHERCLHLCQVANLVVPFPIVASHLGYAYALSGRVGEALPLLEQAVERSWHDEYYVRPGAVDDLAR
jgi:tetratricopeptide (TPR) repeat protein